MSQFIKSSAMSNLADPIPRSWRLRLRLSVRTLMLVVLLLGGSLGWIVYRARLERDAEEAVARVGGHIQYDWQWIHGKVMSTARPSWLTRHLGSGYFEHIVAVSGGDFDDEAMARLGRLDHLEWLITYPSRVTDAGMSELQTLTGLRRLQVASERATGASLASLSGMRQLESLRLYQIRINNSDLVHLAKLTSLEELCIESPLLTDACVAPLLSGRPNLKHLGLSGRGITDTGIGELSHHANLNRVSLMDTQISDAGIALLSRLPLLAHLDITGTQITDTGLRHLSRMKQLGILLLNRTRVTDAGIASISGLPALGYLDLSGTQITDVGVGHLAKTQSLMFLVVKETAVTDSGIAAFQKEHPGALVPR
jgi:Leucine-rich repeat (LRR) protein